MATRKHVSAPDGAERVSRETRPTDYIAETFGAVGHLSRVIPGYVPRPGQVQMARAVDRAIRDDAHLLVEGPCGIGKTIGALVPATGSGKSVLVVTANNALSEQYMEKDLPALQSAVPWAFSFALLKGRANFLCPDAMEKAEPKYDLDQHEKIRQWAGTTLGGDRSELPFEPKPSVWAKYSTSAEACKGNKCRFRSGCFALAARDRAKGADVLVTNYHMLFSHLALGLDTYLTDRDLVICDEFHKAADISRDFFGFRLNVYTVKFAARLLHTCGAPELQHVIETSGNAFFSQLRSHARSGTYKARLRRPHVADSKRLADALREARGIYEGAMAGATEDREAELKIVRNASRNAAHRIAEAMALKDDGKVYYLEDAKTTSLCARLIHAGAVMKRTLFGGFDSVVGMSATLAVNGKFDFVKREAGAEDARTLRVESPFDFDEQALLVVPSDLPQPNDRDFTDAVAAKVGEVIKLAGGRTLGLFTSYRNLDAVYEHVKNCGFRVLRQGDAPRTQLVDEFRRDVKSVLLGTESFWAGVDVPGESLSCVVIDRLPFLTPADPVLDAVSERDRNWFFGYSLPRAVISFKQGVGRLVRRVDDRGCVVVLDRRIVDKAYGKQFVKSIPPMPWTRKIGNVGKFLNGST